MYPDIEAYNGWTILECWINYFLQTVYSDLVQFWPFTKQHVLSKATLKVVEKIQKQKQTTWVFVCFCFCLFSTTFSVYLLPYSCPSSWCPCTCWAGPPSTPASLSGHWTRPWAGLWCLAGGVGVGEGVGVGVEGGVGVGEGVGVGVEGGVGVGEGVGVEEGVYNWHQD